MAFLGPFLIFSFVIVVLYLLLKHLILSKTSPISLKGRHVFITGGSKGIGKALALEAAKQGANVTIVARSEGMLKDTAEQLKQICDINAVSTGLQQQNQWFSLDVTKGMDTTAATVSRAEASQGPIDVLINNAGGSVQDGFEALPPESFEKQMSLNYLSAVYATRAVVPSMKKRQEGRIVFVSSAAGQIGIWGYSAYSAAKFALRGLAEALQMELTPFGIRVTVVYPPNTATEGFQEEVKSMPLEVQQISETAGLFDPKDVAWTALRDVCAGNTASVFGLDGWMLGTLTAGAAPVVDAMQAMQQVMLAGVLRLVIVVYLYSFDRIVHKCKLQKEAGKQK